MTTVVTSNRIVHVVSGGTQGPSGPAGADGSGNVIPSETEPLNPVEGMQWLKPSTKQLSVYLDGVWEQLVLKSEIAASSGNIVVNGGYF